MPSRNIKIVTPATRLFILVVKSQNNDWKKSRWLSFDLRKNFSLWILIKIWHVTFLDSAIWRLQFKGMKGEFTSWFIMVMLEWRGINDWFSMNWSYIRQSWRCTVCFFREINNSIDWHLGFLIVPVYWKVAIKVDVSLTLWCPK